MKINEWIYSALSLPRVAKRGIVVFVDFASCILSCYLSFYLRLGDWQASISGGEWRLAFLIEASILISMPIFWAFGLYREIFRFSGRMAFISLIRASVVYAAIFILFFTVIGIDGVPRTVGIIQPIILLLLIGLTRSIASLLLGNSYRHELKLGAIPRVLIYGAGHAGIQLASALSHSFEMQVVGFLDDDYSKQGQVILGKKIYSPNNILNIVRDQNVSKVLLAMPSVSRFRRNQILNLIKESKVAVQTLPSMVELAQGKIGPDDILPLDIDDLLGRETSPFGEQLISRNCFDKKVLITGAGGSIGSELSRQVIDQLPKTLILLDSNEFALYKIQEELQKRLTFLGYSHVEIVALLASVTDEKRMHIIVKKYQPDIIYHAAAYKHVPLVESNPLEGIKNNILGTLVIAKIAMTMKVPNFVLVSTDKAVRPTNIMGATKRVAEMILQGLSPYSEGTLFAMVRFGNVLDSSGSVVPKFREQIKSGGPITITDFRVTRYFMTIPEAAQLVIQAGALATGGDVFLLHMGQPIQVVDLAYRMIELSGFSIRNASNPSGDIEVVEIGLRPGEKLFEELLIDGEPEATSHPKIFKSHENYMDWVELESSVDELHNCIDSDDLSGALIILKKLVPGYSQYIPN